MYAVIRTGGKQYKVAEGDIIQVERLDAEEGSKIDIKDVLMVANDNDVTVGTPMIKGAKVTAEVKTQGRGPKIKIIKFKRRKQYRRQGGHRQAFTELAITAIKA